METKQIISWLRDKADRADNPSWTRMMHKAADRLKELDANARPTEADKAELMQILRNPIYPRLDGDPVEILADYLIDNGVRVTQDVTQSALHRKG